MIHYHGTPLTPRAELYKMGGRHFCVSFARPEDAAVCMAIGQSVLWDNGAFSAHTRNEPVDEMALYRWIEPRLFHPHRAVILDRINGSVEDQRQFVMNWPFSPDLSWPVWHLDKSLDYLSELADSFPGLCLGSTKDYWQVGSESWSRRMDQAFNHLARRGPLPWVHGLRMLAQIGRWPLASADSVNVARNFKRNGMSPVTMAAEIDARQPALKWEDRPEQEEMTV